MTRAASGPAVRLLPLLSMGASAAATAAGPLAGLPSRPGAHASLLDGRPLQAIDLPDRDGRNDGSAREHDETYSLVIPPGKHRVTIQNTGGDWATVSWYAFGGEMAR